MKCSKNDIKMCLQRLESADETLYSALQWAVDEDPLWDEIMSASSAARRARGRCERMLDNSEREGPSTPATGGK